MPSQSSHSPGHYTCTAFLQNILIKEVIYWWEHSSSGRSFLQWLTESDSSHLSLSKQSSKWHKLRHLRNICPFIQLHSKPLTLGDWYWCSFLQQCFLCIFPQRLLIKECSFVCCRTVCYFSHFSVAGRTSVSPVVCGFLSLAMKYETTKEASKHLLLSSVKFCTVLDWISHSLKHGW